MYMVDFWLLSHKDRVFVFPSYSLRERFGSSFSLVSIRTTIFMARQLPEFHRRWPTGLMPCTTMAIHVDF
jgi:hypothetical protein